MTYLYENADRIIINHVIDGTIQWDSVSRPSFYQDRISRDCAWAIIKYKKINRKLPNREELISSMDLKKSKLSEQEIGLWLSMTNMDADTLDQLVKWWLVNGMVFDTYTGNLEKNTLTQEEKTKLTKIADLLKAGKWDQKIHDWVEQRWLAVCEPRFFVKERTPRLSGATVDSSIPYDMQLENYAWIGSDIYLIYPNGDKVKYNQQGFKARFPGRDVSTSHIPNIYSSEGYEPDYFNSTRRIQNNKYNTFRRPDVEIKEGQWPMTKQLLQHIFGEQYELGLELCWVWRNRPKQATPGLALPGDEDSGKTTFADWLSMVYGNVNTITMTQLTNNENVYVRDCQFIVIEETSGKDQRNMSAQEIVDKLKPMVTQTGKKLPSKKLYENSTEVDYYGHVLILSNDISPIQMKGESTRWWVRYVRKPKEHQRITNFVELLKQEVGPFLYYLDNEFMPTRTESKERLWFNPNEYWTMDKDTAIANNNSKLYTAIKECLLEWFDDNDEEACYFDQTSLWDAIKDDVQCSKYDVRDCLINEFRWGPPAEKRKNVTDSLTQKIGQTPRPSRKMKYWAIDRNFKHYEEIEYGVAFLG
jgi:hypothetical protein